MKQIWISNKLLSEIRIANVGHQHFFIKMKNVNEADLRMFLCSQPKKKSAKQKNGSCEALQRLIFIFNSKFASLEPTTFLTY